MKVFANRLMLLLAAIELSAGVLRNGIMQWYPVFAKEVKQPGAGLSRSLGFAALYFPDYRRFSGFIRTSSSSRAGPPWRSASG